MSLKLLLVLQAVFTGKLYVDASPVRVVTYGDPCPPTCNFPYFIEVPVPTVEKEAVIAEKSKNIIKTVDSSFRVTDRVDIETPAAQEEFRSLRYPFFVEVPIGGGQSEVTAVEQDKESYAISNSLRGKSYDVKVEAVNAGQTTLEELYTPRVYDFGVQVMPSVTIASETRASVEKAVPRLPPMETTVDTVLVPACEAPCA